jgi:hypothetical protein
MTSSKRSSGRRSGALAKRRSSAHENPTGTQTALIVVGVVLGLATVGGVAYAVMRKKDPLSVPNSIQPGHTYKIVVTAPAGTPVTTKYTTVQVQSMADKFMVPGLVKVVSGPDYTNDASGVTATIVVKYQGTIPSNLTPAEQDQLRSGLSAKGMTLTITDQG